MIIGLDKTFKPEWVYKILQIAKPNTLYEEKKEEILNIIEFDGLEAKNKVSSIIRRYYLLFYKKQGKEYFQENYLHDLAKKYSFETMKPLILFVLLCNCEIASYLQKNINQMFSDKKTIDKKVLQIKTKEKYGDRTIIRYAVSYYLTILSYFDILIKNKLEYKWKNKTIDCTDYIIKDMILIYSNIKNKYELEKEKMEQETQFSIYDLKNLENILREYNTINWKLQKRLDSNKIIISDKIKIKK
jgi:hypothetical protein